jgi:uncharacterized protein YndB with AHSA1/START domain
MSKTQPAAGEQAISDEAVRARTGKTWAQWGSILDRWNAAEKDHKAIARHLADRHGLDAWWSQAVTVRYEQDRGMRKIGERADGSYEVSVQRTIATTPEQAFNACTDAKLLSKWFTTKATVDLREGGRYSNADGDTGEFRRIDPPRRVRFTWGNPKHCPGTTVEISFTRRGLDKTAIRIQHMKLASEKDREAMREGWSWALDSLKSFLETGRPVTFETWKKRAKDV